MLHKCVNKMQKSMIGGCLSVEPLEQNSAMDKNDIVPDVLDEAPAGVLTVIYGEKSLQVGQELTPREVKDQPKVTWPADPDKYYFLSMVDPDAPSRQTPTFREINHWAVGNILGNDLKTGLVLAGYRGSGPPEGSGLHRYVFLVYQQPGRIEFDEKPIADEEREARRNYSIRKFAEKYQFGKPLFGNYYEAQFDSYVAEMIQQRMKSGK